MKAPMLRASLFVIFDTTPILVCSQPLDFGVPCTPKSGYIDIVFEGGKYQEMASLNSLRGFVEVIVLEMLSRGRLTNAYAIKQAIASESNGALQIRDGTLYPAIDRMEEKGLISTEANDKFDRRRWTLNITSDGKKYLRLEKVSWRKFRSAIDKILGSR